MSRYTMQLRAVENLYGHEELVKWFTDYNIEDYLTPEQVTAIATKLPNWSKEKLAEKCINKYYMREIGFETPYLFKHMLKVRLDEIMQIKLPYLYSLTIEYDPMANVDYTETYSKNTNDTNSGTSQNAENVSEDVANTGTSTATSNSNNSGSGLEVNSDTPQGEITKANILAGKYASTTNANETEGATSSEANAEQTNNTDRDFARTQSGNYSQSGSKAEEFSRHIKGNSGVMTTAQKLVQQFRDIQIAVDKEIIDDLDVLFFGLLS